MCTLGHDFNDRQLRLLLERRAVLLGLGAKVEVCRNDEITLAEIAQKSPAGIYLPGPYPLLRRAYRCRLLSTSPVSCRYLVFALGNRASARFWWRCRASERVMHGKTSPIHHHGVGVFGAAQPVYSRAITALWWMPQHCGYLEVTSLDRGRAR